MLKNDFSMNSVIKRLGTCRGYREEGRSAPYGSDWPKSRLQQLLEDSGKGLFDVVVVHSIEPLVQKSWRLDWQLVGALCDPIIVYLRLEDTLPDWIKPRLLLSGWLWNFEGLRRGKGAPFGDTEALAYIYPRHWIADDRAMDQNLQYVFNQAMKMKKTEVRKTSRLNISLIWYAAAGWS